MTTIKKSVRITLNPSVAGNSTFNGRCFIRNSAGEELRVMKSEREMWNAKDYDETKNHYIREMKLGDVLSINYVWEANENLVIKEERHKKEKEVFDFLCQHQNVVFKDEVNDDGGMIVAKSKNTNMKTPMFILEVLEETAEKDDESFTKILSAMNIVNDMSKEQREELVYLYGGNPRDLNEQQVRKWLVDPNTGRATAKGTIDDFLTMMNKKDGISGKTVMANVKIILNKALVMKKVNYTDGQYYTESGIPLGYTEDEVLSYIMNNENYASSLKKSLSHTDYLFDIKGELHAEKKSITTDSILDKDFDTQMAWAKEKMIQGASLIKDPVKLRNKIEEYIKHKARTNPSVGVVAE